VALQAFLFKDDKALNACAVRDADHITPGSVGPQVGKLQEALMFLDGLAIENSELAAKRYGPSTASAVLSYKRRRKIINPAYQTQADNIVGIMTIASLDRELLARENKVRASSSVDVRKVAIVRRS